ncbi:MAG: SDR family oxidoreductase [Acidobacteriota bacterium]|nr:SDR family oxidoreductase [Acidobacteriota bacterium]
MAPKRNASTLRGQVALVTGGGRRIGREIALELARAGAHVAVNYNTSSAGAIETVRKVTALGVRSLALRADVSKPAEVGAMFKTLRKTFRRLDLLVNNAGVFFPRSWDRLTESDWDLVLGANLKGPFYCAQEAARVMVRQGRGQIINISSLGGIRPWPEHMHYCSSKAGLIMLTKCLARALAPRILVNSIAPGTILFPGEENDPAMIKIVRATPLRKGGRASDIAGAALFLALHNKFITGQVIVVDGGKSIA